MRHIERDGYYAVDWPDRSDLSLRDLWHRFPSLVVGHFLVNTSFDSGLLTLSESEEEAGWRMEGGLAHSPRISGPRSIPCDQFDEWLVFDQPTTVSSFETMVNYTGFSPVAFEWTEKWEQFWSQIRALQPLHVIGENHGVYVVTRDSALFREVMEANPAARPNAVSAPRNSGKSTAGLSPPAAPVSVVIGQTNMRFKALATLLISLIGFYSIFSAILVAGIPLLLLVMAPFQGDGLEYVGFTTLMCIPQFVLPFLLGLFMIRKAPRLGQWMLTRDGLDGDQEAEGVSFEDLSFLCFSLLGLYMLSTTVPDGLRTLAAWFQAKAAETQVYSGISSEDFWHQRFPELIYHVAAIAFATFVFIRGRSIGRFVASLRTAGTRPFGEGETVQPARPSNDG